MPSPFIISRMWVFACLNPPSPACHPVWPSPLASVPMAIWPICARQLVDEHLAAADVLRLEELPRRRDRFVGPFRHVLERRSDVRGVRLHVVRRTVGFRRELHVLQRAGDGAFDAVSRSGHFDLHVGRRQPRVRGLQQRMRFGAGSSAFNT